MESWLMFAFASMMFAGLNAFVLKVIAINGYNKDYIFLMRFIIGFIFSLILYVVTSDNYTGIFLIGPVIILLAFFKGLSSYIVSYSKVKSLENVSTTIFFPVYKTFTLSSTFLMSFLLFGEHLTNNQLIGLLIGLIIPFMLITKKENEKQTNMKKGFFYILISGLGACFGLWSSKYIHVLNISPEMFLVLFLFIGMIISYLKLIYSTKKKSLQTNIITKQDRIYAGLVGILLFGASYSILKAVSGNLVIAYTINSFSILIPIILSVIFYKEEMTWKKAFVVLLSIMSVILFI